MKNMFLFIGWFVLEFNHSAPVKDSTLCYIFFNINGFCLGSRHTWPKKPTLSRFGEFFPLSDHPLSMQNRHSSKLKEYMSDLAGISCNSMNNLSSYCRLTDSRMRASDADLPVIWRSKLKFNFKTSNSIGQQISDYLDCSSLFLMRLTHLITISQENNWQ